jgi:Protein of unknown function (DUF3617)
MRKLSGLLATDALWVYWPHLHKTNMIAGKTKPMNRFGLTMCCLLSLLSAAAAAENMIEPGQWRTTSKTLMNGAATPPQMKARCLTPEQTADVAKTFGPVMGTVNSNCEPTEYTTGERTLKWRLQCKGQLDMEVSGNFNFDTPLHYTAIVASKGWMAGALMSDVKTEIEGERVGECGQ